MQIIYCESCGHRIPNEDLEAGRVVVVDEYKYFCQNCIPRTEPQHAAGRSSRKIVLVTPAPSAAQPNRKLSAAGLAAHSSSHSGHKHPAVAPRPLPVMPVAVGIGLFVLGSVALFAFTGSSAAPVRSGPDVAKARRVSSAPVARAVSPQNPPESAPKLAPPKTRATDAGSPVDREQQAEEALAEVLKWEGAAKPDSSERIRRLEDFITRFSDSRAAARAQLMVTQLQTDAANNSAAAAAVPESVPPSAKPADGAPPPVPAQQARPGSSEVARALDNNDEDDTPAVKKPGQVKKPESVMSSLITSAVPASTPEHEAAAAKAWAEVLKSAEARDFKNLDDALKKFNETNAGTHFIDAHAAELRALGDLSKAAANIDKGLAGWWKFDEGSGGKAADSSGNGNNGNLAGHPQWIAGKYGSALAFTRHDDVVVIPNSPSVERVQEGEYSISAWIRPEDMPSSKDGSFLTYTVLAKTGWHEGLFYERDGNMLGWHYLAGGKCMWNTSYHVYAPNVMHHVAYTVSRSSGASHIYVDGVLDGTSTWKPAEDPNDYGQETWKIGQAQPGNKQYAFPFKGVIDDVRLYNRVLTPADIAVLAEVPVKKWIAADLPGSAHFVGVDENTRGNWKGAFGANGCLSFNDRYIAPPYVQVNLSGWQSFQFAGVTKDGRGLQRVEGERLSACIFTESSATIDFNFIDERSHRVSLYCCDWDAVGRSARFEVMDANGTILDARELANYSMGKYLTWDFKGRVKIVGRSTKINVAISAIFFDR